MKREEKNQQMKKRILDSALDEFSAQGYGASSVNTICAAQGISKGIVYHYFTTKDELYLACVDECFRLLTAYLKEKMPLAGGAEEQLEGYFKLRSAFFREHPVYRRIFCEAVLSPPARLCGEVQARKRAFDDLNIEILEGLLAQVSLRHRIVPADVVEMFRQVQDFLVAKFRGEEFEAYEESCKKMLDILLYGIIEGRGPEHEGK